jgi:hypothetical protein
MLRAVGSSVSSAVLLSVLALTACAGSTIGAPSTRPGSYAAVPMNATYRFKVLNDTDYDVTMRTFDEGCMLKTLGGEISPHTTQHVDVETKTGQTCESHKESYFTTSFSKKGPGDYVNYRFVKRTLSSWKLEHGHSGPRSILAVELTNELTYSLVKIYKIQ